jgi:hypothetical protein
MFPSFRADLYPPPLGKNLLSGDLVLCSIEHSHHIGTEETQVFAKSFKIIPDPEYSRMRNLQKLLARE